MNYKIYCCTDTENGYKYIGLTYKDIKKRLSEHYTEAMHTDKKSPFKNAIRNGRKFTYEIIEDNIESLDEALILEKYYIDKYRTCINFSDCKGYNGTIGGEYHSSSDDREFIFKYDTDYNFIEAYANISMLANKLGIEDDKLVIMLNSDYITIGNYIYTYYDYKLPIKCSQKHNNGNLTLNINAGINQYGLDGKFVRHYNSAEEAARCINTYSSSIIKVCRGKHNSHKGYIWRYARSVDDTKDLLLTDTEKGLNNSHNKREVIQLDLNGNAIKTFESAHDASRQLGISVNNIRQACTNIKLSAGGFKWKFKNENNQLKHKRSIVQMDVYGNIIGIYESMMKAAEITGVSRSGIYDCCADRSKTAGGYRWAYKD